MLTAIVVWCLTIALATVGQIGVIFSRLRHYRSYRTQPLPAAQLPATAVILCLRGSDPYLDSCLAQLTDQNYPDYDLWIVLDSPLDPARIVAERWQTISPRARVHLTYMDDISVQTSLKCNALIHGIKQLDDRIEAVVLIDADTIPYSNWLRNMVSPLVGDDIGIVTGSRWYDPSSRCWGSQLRFAYNAFALVPMCIMDALWPGSLSLRREVFSNPNLIKRLSQAPCEDDVFLRTLRETGLRLLNTPACVMLNREECGVASCFGFVRRQLLWTRLSNPAWRGVLIATAVAYFWLCGGAVLLALAGVYGTSMQVFGLATFMIGVLAADMALIVGLHRAVSQQIEQTAGVPPIRISVRASLQLSACLLMLISFFTAAVVSAALARSVQWRGVFYVVQSPRRIEMVAYAPYATDELCAVSNHSL